MGTDLFERRGISPRYYIIFAIVVGVFFAAGVLIGWFSHTQPTTQSTSGQTEADDSSYFIDFILNNVNKDNIRNYLREYSKEPRLEGTEKDAELARLMQSQWQANGLDDVHLATYNVLLSFPNKTNPNVIQIKDTTSGKVMFETHKYEVVLTPAENNSDVVPPYNAYSPAADVTGDLIYVNYGRIEDFQLLGNMSVNFTGAIVIARYGKIFRGDKVKNAQRFNASGVILYSDPIDYNVGESKPYPDSWWLPPTGIQRGTVGSDGDQETPLYPSTYYANRVKATSLPTIPCQPIGYIDAIELLSKVRLNVNNYNEVRPVYNVIGLIRGSEEPDRYVLLGNHHDAWVFGAMDPLSGSASLTELTRCQYRAQGHRPRRTIVFCSWDAEEQGLLGSVEWVEPNYTLGIGSSPLLQDVAYESAKLVPSQDPAYTTFYDMWLSRPRSIKTVTEPDLYYSLGSGSDQGAFYQRAGVSCIDMWMTYDEARIPIPYYPLYHSSYETFYAFENFVDPGFLASAAITKFWGILASKMANSKLLPYKVERYSAAVSNFYSSLDKSSWQEHGVNVAAMDSAVHNFTKATKAFQQKLDTDASLLSSSLRLRMVNDRLMQLERAFLDPEGLPGQPAQKHVMFAPSQFDAYVDNSFPGIVDTVLQIQLGNDKWDQLKQQVYIATYTIQSAAFSLEDIGLCLPFMARGKEYSKEPRLEGTEKDAELARLMQSQWQANGLDDVHLATYNVLLSFPNKTNPNVGDLVYVNYGREKDFSYLTKTLSVNLTGAIVIARYGKIYRGDKVKFAERYNAAGVILYSDPSDFNIDLSKPYPDSWWLPPTGIQRGVIAGWCQWRPGNAPTTPIGLTLRHCQKYPVSPSGTLTPLNFLGAPKGKQLLEVKPVYNVIGIIKGSEEPDRYVLLGNHHDAWAFGAFDPLSGAASLTELTRVFGQLLKQGHRPRRTVVFCSWDAEEQGLLGSNEWVEEHLKVLLQRGVAYLNVDYSAVSNFTMAAGTSPLLQDALYEAAKLVPSIDPAFTTIYDMWLHRPTSGEVDKEPYVYYSLGSSSDMAAFYQRAGVSSVDMWITYDEANLPIITYPLYHSSYETFFAYDTFIDPGFVANAAMTKVWGVMTSNLANCKLLPFKVERYSTAVSTFYTSLNKTSWKEHGVNIEAMDSAIMNFTKATKAFQEQIDQSISAKSSPLQLRMVNDRLMQLERAFLDPEGLPGSPDQKHVMFAPSQFDNYVDNSFPGIVDTMVQIQQGYDKWDELKQQVYISTYTIQSVASTLEDIGL
ncbi:hypothetical protein C0Q70_19856 [Pomacea canaliculata]|uniref:Aminopeptidase NAALADL1 n=1 Tax=Pomacea canaliculata TaxID=400727 RepID=A0A2T7NDW6_POMCA|nr:hypothetical protein C0Q70_19856 [Pomacea canaliculata]